MNKKNNLKTTLLLIAILYTAAAFIDVTIENTLLTNYRSAQKAATTASLNEVSKAVQGRIEQNLNLISGVPAYLSTRHNVTKEEFEAIAANIFKMQTMLRSMALTDGFIVKYVYPEQVNGKVLGVDLSKVPGQRNLALRAASRMEMVADGPIPLVQGKYGIIGRQAIYRNNRFDSMISAVIDINKIRTFARADAARRGLTIAFRNNKDTESVFGNKYLFKPDSGAVIVPMNIMEMNWSVAGIPSDGFPTSFPYENYIHLYIFLFMLLATVLIIYKHVKVRENIGLNTMLRMAQSVGQMGSIVCLSSKHEVVMSEEAFRLLRHKYVAKMSVDNFLKMVDKEDREKTLHIMMPASIKPDTKTEITFKLNNHEVYIKLTAEPLYNIHNELAGFEGVLSDITRQKKILNELAESESRFRDLVLCTSDMVWEMDLECHYTYFTGRAQEIYGYSEEDMLGKTPGFLEKTSSEKTSVFFCSTIVRNGLPIKDMERWIKDTEGNERCFLINGVPFFDEQGNLKGYRGVDKDITEQFKLKTEREMIFRVSRDGIAVIDHKARFKDCNEAYLKMTGYSYEELMTKSCYDLTPPEEIERSKNMLKELLETGYYDKFEKTCLTKDHRRVTVQMTLSVLSEDKILVSSRDITDIKQYQDKIEKSEKQLKSIFDISPIPMSMLDENNKPIMLNSTFTETFGYDIASVPTLDDWWRRAYPDPGYRDHVTKAWFEYMRQIKTGENPEPLQAVVTCADDTKKVVVFLYAPFNNGCIIAGYDVTSRVSTEKKLQEYVSIVDQNVSISRCSEDGIITTVSEAFCKLCGYTREELTGNMHSMLHNPNMDNKIYDELMTALFNGNSWHGELYKIRKDGTPFWTDTLIYPMTDECGIKKGYIAIDQDITDKKHIEQLSVTDKLTGIYNRIRLDEVLHTEFVRFSRSATPFSVILFDIDFFKKVNDTYGHLVGDAVLRALADLVKASVRENDIFGRWGGEEFLIICAGTDSDGAGVLAEKLRNKIELYDFPEVKTITCSFGVAEVTEKGTDNMVKNADDSLYKAKQSGRNRVAVYKA